MLRVHSIFVIGGFLLFLMSCAKPPTHIAMPVDIPSALTSSDVVIVLSQKEMVANVVPSEMASSDSAMYGGLGALDLLVLEGIDLSVETTRSAIAEENIVPIRKALAKYDVGGRIKQAFLPELRAISWLHVKQIETLYDNHSNLAGRQLPKGSSDALVLIKASYKLTSDFYALVTNAELYIYPRSQELKKLTPPQDGLTDSHVPFYMKKALQWSHLPGDNSRDQNIAAEQWTRNQGQLIKQALDETIKGLAEELLAGLRNPYR